MPVPERTRPAARPTRTAPRRGRSRAPATRARIRPGLVIIPIIALLLAGIVWINVSKLAFTAESGRVVERSRQVEAQNVRLRAQIDRARATVIDRAQARLGMGLPPDSSVTPLKVPTP